MILYGLLNTVENNSFIARMQPIGSISIVLPLIGGQKRLEEVISKHAPIGAKLVAIGEIQNIDVVLYGSSKLIGDNLDLDYDLTVIPINYYGFN